MTDLKVGDKAIVTGNGNNKDPNAVWIMHGFYLGERVEIVKVENAGTRYLCKGKILQMVWHEHLINAE